MAEKRAGERRAAAMQSWLPAAWEAADVAALQALARGVANEGQQKRALNYIVNVLGMTYEHTYFPASERDSCHAQGRRYVGLQIVKLVNMPAHLVKKAKHG
ncbi:MAG: hypothetical protein AB7R90_04085 [Reyranellaceae bacterium]